jgi:hypothetical protein
VELPGIFEDPVIAIDELSADLQWQLKGQDIAVWLTISNSAIPTPRVRAMRAGTPARRRARVFRGAGPAGEHEPRRRQQVHRYLPLECPKARAIMCAKSVVQERRPRPGSASGRPEQLSVHRLAPGEFRVSADVPT